MSFVFEIERTSCNFLSKVQSGDLIFFIDMKTVLPSFSVTWYFFSHTDFKSPIPAVSDLGYEPHRKYRARRAENFFGKYIPRSK